MLYIRILLSSFFIAALILAGKYVYQDVTRSTFNMKYDRKKL